jgi:serine/threonine-protein kinase
VRAALPVTTKKAAAERGPDTRRTAALETRGTAGTVNVNALPWASVIIDGAAVGDTPLANLPLSAGPHDVVFKHPELGERRLRVNVTPGTPLRVSTDLTTNGK